MATVVGLGHVGIYVRDLERMVAFYRDTLGMRINSPRRTPPTSGNPRKIKFEFNERCFFGTETEKLARSTYTPACRFKTLFLFRFHCRFPLCITSSYPLSRF